MAKCKATRVGLDQYEHQSIAWSRDMETGFYWKTTQELLTDTSTNTTKKIGKPVKAELPFKVSDESDYSASFQYTGIDGNPATVYLQVITAEELEAAT